MIKERNKSEVSAKPHMQRKSASTNMHLLGYEDCKLRWNDFRKCRAVGRSLSHCMLGYGLEERKKIAWCRDFKIEIKK